MQSGSINIDEIILLESSVRRKLEIPEKIIPDVSFSMRVDFKKDKSELRQFVALTFKDQDENIVVEIAFLGHFSQGSDSNLQLLEWCKNGYSLAIIIPYIREELDNRLVKAKLPPFYLPPANAKAMMNQYFKKNAEASVSTIDKSNKKKAPQRRQKKAK